MTELHLDRQVAAAGLAIIKDFEKYRGEAYLPTPKDVWTIGWGHTRNVEEGDTCTVEQAEEWLRADCYDAERAVNRLVHVELTQNQFDALTSLVFNIGSTNFATSTIRKLLNVQDFAAAAEQFPRWNKQKGKVLNGLTRRRKIERALFLK